MSGFRVQGFGCRGLEFRWCFGVFELKLVLELKYRVPGWEVQHFVASGRATPITSTTILTIAVSPKGHHHANQPVQTLNPKLTPGKPKP